VLRFYLTTGPTTPAPVGAFSFSIFKGAPANSTPRAFG
jgi:hypothetical protein